MLNKQLYKIYDDGRHLVLGEKQTHFMTTKKIAVRFELFYLNDEYDVQDALIIFVDNDEPISWMTLLFQ